MKGIFIIAFAVFIDALQALFALLFTTLQFATPVGGGIGGALAAGYYCWSVSSGIFSGITNAAACATAGGTVGAGISALAVPIGGAVDVMISIVLGGALIAALAFSGMFYPGTVIGGFIGEQIPFLDALVPGWTLMALRCVQLKKKGERALVGTQTEQTQAAAQMVASRERFWEDVRAKSAQKSYVEQTA
jgi:hypothetical protein